jgi:hypothetical protein
MNRLLSLWILSLALAGLLASVVIAQVTRSAQRVVSGADLGFRIEGQDVKGRGA